MYKNAQELLELCHKSGKRAWKIALEAEIKLTGLSQEKLLAHFDSRLQIMEGSATKALLHRQATKGGLIDGAKVPWLQSLP